MTTPGQSGSGGRNEDVDRVIASRIREGRVKRGATQDQLGRSVGVSCQQIQKYEQGASRPSAGRLKQIADALDLDPGWFFPQPRRSAPRASLDAGEIAQLERLKAQRPDVYKAIRQLVELTIEQIRD